MFRTAEPMFPVPNALSLLFRSGKAMFAEQNVHYTQYFGEPK